MLSLVFILCFHDQNTSLLFYLIIIVHSINF